jgi:hypothetical protein
MQRNVLPGGIAISVASLAGNGCQIGVLT